MLEETGSAGNDGRYTFTRETLLGGVNVNARGWCFVDPKLWHEDVKAPDDNIDIIAATTYMARAIADYTDSPTGDDELFREFQQDFEGWTEVMFKRAHATYTKKLKRILRFKGVYTGHINMIPSEAVFKLLKMEDCPRWPDDQFGRAVFDKRSAAYMLQQRKVQGQQPAEPHRNTVDTTPNPNQQRQKTQQLPSICNNFDQFCEYTPAYPQRSKGLSVSPIEPSGETDPYKAIPPIEFDNEKPNWTTISTFLEIWDHDNNYTGKLYDLLDFKVKILYNICYHADINPGQFHAIFARILDGPAKQYYIRFVDPQVDTFLTAYTKLKNHFDTDVNYSHYYADWTTISFVKFRRENPDKNLHEVLNSMLNKLELCQRALGRQYMGEHALRNTVITACRGVKELEMALYKPSLECEVLFRDLRSSIGLAMAASVNFTEADPNEQYYLERRYNSHNGRSGAPCRRGTFRKRSGDKPSNSKRIEKKCYICDKTGCWSTNHTREERKRSKARYIAHCEILGKQMEFSVFLVAYEGENDEKYY